MSLRPSKRIVADLLLFFLLISSLLYFFLQNVLGQAAHVLLGLQPLGQDLRKSLSNLEGATVEWHIDAELELNSELAGQISSQSFFPSAFASGIFTIHESFVRTTQILDVETVSILTDPEVT